MNGKPRLTVLMPAYNEARGLAQSVGLVLAKLHEMAIPAELLIVDDCSRDGTAEIADALAAAEADVLVIHHPENRGIGGGMVTGFAAARGEWLILIPADLALDLDELNKYWDAAPQADIVVGIRSSFLGSTFERSRCCLECDSANSTISACIGWMRCARYGSSIGTARSFMRR
ncbi:MAG: glycosyltransferase family 2 protein [Anaerolineae bacterium]|nr:glycosyltransferase family 2 protein [Anaerolineae bacterium]